MMIRTVRCHTPLRRPVYQAVLHKKRLINIFNRAGIFPDRCCQRVQPDRAPGKFADNRKKDIPVILAIGPNFPPLLGRKKVTFYRLENGEYLPAAETAAHFVVVTGIVGEYLQVSSWGKEYYMFWPEYQRYVKKCSSFFASNICRIREKKKRKIFK